MKTLLKAVGVVLCMTAAVHAAEVTELVAQLKNQDPALRRTAAKELGEAGANAKTAVPALSVALKDKDWHVRRFSALALANIGPDAKKATPNLAALLNNAKEQKEVQEAAAEALGKIGAGSVDALVKAVKDSDRDPMIRKKAIEGLAAIGPDAKSAVPALTRALKDGTLRLDAAIALGDIGPGAKSALETLKETAANKKNKKDKAFKQAVKEAVRKINAK